jgi:hypothetical protein
MTIPADTVPQAYLEVSAPQSAFDFSAGDDETPRVRNDQPRPMTAARLAGWALVILTSGIALGVIGVLVIPIERKSLGEYATPEMMAAYEFLRPPDVSGSRKLYDGIWILCEEAGFEDIRDVLPKLPPELKAAR